MYSSPMSHRHFVPSALLVAALFTFGSAPARTLLAQASGAVEAGLPHTHAAGKPSAVLTVHTAQGTISLTLADLQTMPQATVSVFNAHNQQNEIYSGPLVSAVLAKAGIVLTEASQHGLLDSYMLAQGTDGYFVLYSAAEVEPGLHKDTAIVALAQAGQPLTRTGAFQLISPEDAKPARWVRNLTALTVIAIGSPTPDAVPPPEGMTKQKP